MDIQQTKIYFIYGIPLSLNILKNQEGFQEGYIRDIAINPQFVARFPVQPFPTFEYTMPVTQRPSLTIPVFYTKHYSKNHTPYFVDYPNRVKPISAERLNQSEFFKTMPIEDDIVLKWDMILALETCPIISLKLEVQSPLLCEQVHRLSSLHLSSYAFIPTSALPELFNPSDTPPEYLNMEQLVATIQKKLYREAGLPEELASASLETLVREAFTSLEIKGKYEGQEDFLATHQADLVKLISKPFGYEMGKLSRDYTEKILQKDKIWSVTDDTLFIFSYAGGIFIEFLDLNTVAPIAVSNYQPTSEISVLHTFRLAVSDYYLLRLLDEKIEVALDLLEEDIRRHQTSLKNLYTGLIRDETETLQALNKLVMRVSNLRFKYYDLFEELDNADKLIDEATHIDLLNKINDALLVRNWRDSILSRLENLHSLVHTLENSYERFLDFDDNVDNRKREQKINLITVIFSFFALIEAMDVLSNILFGENHPIFELVHQLKLFNGARHINLLGSEIYVGSIERLITFVLFLIAILVFGFIAISPIYSDAVQRKLKRSTNSTKEN